MKVLKHPAKWVSVAFLLAMIGWQAVGVALWDAETQRGTGFAMFSTTETAASRLVVVTATTDAGLVDISLTDAQWLAAQPLRLDPRADVASEFARQLDLPVNAHAVTIEVFGLESSGNVFSRTLVKTFTIEVGDR